MISHHCARSACKSFHSELDFVNEAASSQSWIRPGRVLLSATLVSSLFNFVELISLEQQQQLLKGAGDRMDRGVVGMGEKEGYGPG